MGAAVEYLGPGPADEPVVGTYAACGLYRAAVRLVFGDEPPGAELRVAPAPPGRDYPYELAVVYDPGDAIASGYARRCVGQPLPTWAAAGLEPPVDTPGRVR